MFIGAVPAKRHMRPKGQLTRSRCLQLGCGWNALRSKERLWRWLNAPKASTTQLGISICDRVFPANALEHRWRHAFGITLYLSVEPRKETSAT